MAINMAATMKQGAHILNVFYEQGACWAHRLHYLVQSSNPALTVRYKSLDFSDEKTEDLVAYLGPNGFCRPGFQSRFHTHGL